MVWKAVVGLQPTWGMGAFVSKAGADVFSANKYDFLFSTMYENLQILQTGAVVLPGATGSPTYVTISGLPDMGYLPFVMCSNASYEMVIEYLSNTQFRVRRASPVSETNSLNSSTADVVMNYCAFKMPLP
jgi:hypothetical protein